MNVFIKIRKLHLTEFEKVEICNECGLILQRILNYEGFVNDCDRCH